MRDIQYCVIFSRADGAKPSVEKYYYWNRVDAQTHFDIFKDPDPDYPKMYKCIQLLKVSGSLSLLIDEISFLA